MDQIMGTAPVDIAAILASLVAAIFFASEAILGKRGIESGGNPILASLLVTSVSTVIYGTVAFATTDLTILATEPIVGALVFLGAGAVSSGIGVLAVYQGVDRVGASVNTAVVNNRPIFVAILGFVFLSEGVGLSTIGGIVLVVGGLVFIAFSRGGDVRGWEPIELAFPLFAALAFAIGNVGRRYGLVETDIPLSIGIALNAVGGLGILVVYVYLRQTKALFSVERRTYGWFILTGLSTSTALYAMFYALDRERVAIVDSIIATAPLFTLVFTLLFLRDFERITLRVGVGVVLVVIGAVFIVGQ